jgi:predicted RNA-binding Zn-ribbon protein involved in translation (DUF1610 family)
MPNRRTHPLRWLPRLCLATLALCAALFIFNIFWSIILYTPARNSGLWSQGGACDHSIRQIRRGVGPRFGHRAQPRTLQMELEDGLDAGRVCLIRGNPLVAAAGPRGRGVDLGSQAHTGASWCPGSCMAACALAGLVALAVSARAPERWDRPGGVIQLGAGGVLVRWGQVPGVTTGWTRARDISGGILLLQASYDADLDFIWWPHHTTIGSTHTVQVPLWPLLVLTSTAAIWLSHRSRMRTRPGHCPRCGYNLSGLPAPTDPSAAPRCPECGHIGSTT